jgi:hypothetical protein
MWRGDPWVAHGDRTQGDASVPTLHPNHPRLYETNPPPWQFHKNLLVKDLPQVDRKSKWLSARDGKWLTARVNPPLLRSGL